MIELFTWTPHRLLQRRTVRKLHQPLQAHGVVHVASPSQPESDCMGEEPTKCPVSMASALESLGWPLPMVNDRIDDVFNIMGSNDVISAVVLDRA